MKWFEKTMLRILCVYLLICVADVLSVSIAFAACNHENEIMVDRQTYEQIPGNSKYHNMISWMHGFCPDCDTVTWGEERWMTNETEHNFSGNTCFLCGYTKGCSHNNSWPRISFSVGSKKDSDTHYIIGSGWYQCSDCGAHLDSIYMEQDAPHEFVNGVCECGYRKPSSSSGCTHNSTKRATGNKTYEPIEGNDTHHNVVTPYNTVCNSCGKTISTDKKIETALHSLSGNKCTVCGYSKSGGRVDQWNPSATATPYTSRSYTSSEIEISMYKGIATLSWSDTGNNGPYDVYWEMDSYECTDQVCYAEYSVRGKQLDVYGMIPGQNYYIEIYGENDFSIIETVRVPSASSFVDGRLKDSSIKTTIEYRYRPNDDTEYKSAKPLDNLKSTTMENGIPDGKRYGIRYTIRLPQLATTRYFETKKVFRAPNGFYMAEYNGEVEYSDFNNSSGSTRYWYCCGEEFFEELLDCCGYIPTGVYYVDLYWDGMLVNTNSFRVY